MSPKDLKRILDLENEDLGKICNTTTYICYSVPDMINGAIINSQDIFPSKVRMKCNNCGQEDLDTMYEYCPKCGLKFVKE